MCVRPGFALIHWRPPKYHCEGSLTRARTELFEAADTVAGHTLGEEPFPHVFEMTHINPDDVRASLDAFRQYDDHELSLTDATIIALCESRGIDAVLSFDADFDGLVDRIELGH